MIGIKRIAPITPYQSWVGAPTKKNTQRAMNGEANSSPKSSGQRSAIKYKNFSDAIFSAISLGDF